MGLFCSLVGLNMALQKGCACSPLPSAQEDSHIQKEVTVNRISTAWIQQSSPVLRCIYLAVIKELITQPVLIARG